MIRRHFMALLGLAPAAAAIAPSGVVESAAMSSGPEMSVGAILAQSPFAENAVASRIESPLNSARRTLEAVKWARENNLPYVDGPPLGWDVPVDDIQAMRSWSQVTKGRLTRERIKTVMADERIRHAEARYERELKLALAPEWMRRFL